jgi:ferredoxin-like protein FixX
MEKLTDKLFTVKYNEDTGKPHIEIVDQNVCFKKCTGKYCNHFCPAGVYEWNPEQKKNLVSFGNCVVRRLLDRMSVRQHLLPVATRRQGALQAAELPGEPPGSPAQAAQRHLAADGIRFDLRADSRPEPLKCCDRRRCISGDVWWLLG